MFLFPLFYVIREFHRFLHRGKALITVDELILYCGLIIYGGPTSVSFSEYASSMISGWSPVSWVSTLSRGYEVYVK